jgi:hypothetical protein
VLKQLRTHIRTKRPDIVLHHDNARPHTARMVTEYLEKNNISGLPQPPYSPDMAPCDFTLFPEFKKILCGRKFAIDIEVITASQAIFKRLSSGFFLRVFQEWQTRWDQCIEAQGSYFEQL